MRLGRLPARRPVGLADLFHYLRRPLPAAPPVCDPPQAQWGMLGNDQYSDCTLAGVVHLRMANAAEHTETETFPDTGTVVAEYLQLSGGADGGLVEADVLRVWQTTGLFGNRVDGYAPFDHRNQDELRQVTALFGGCYLGVAIPAPAQQQFAAGEPWDLTGTAADRQIEGGHAVPVVGYDYQFAYAVTWGRVQPVTWRWLGVYLEEGWCVLTSEDATAAGVDLAVLQADLAALT